MFLYLVAPVIVASIKSFSYLLTDEGLTLSGDFKFHGVRSIPYYISKANTEPLHTEWCSINARGTHKIKTAFLYTGRS